MTTKLADTFPECITDFCTGDRLLEDTGLGEGTSRSTTPRGVEVLRPNPTLHRTWPTGAEEARTPTKSGGKPAVLDRDGTESGAPTESIRRGVLPTVKASGEAYASSAVPRAVGSTCPSAPSAKIASASASQHNKSVDSAHQIEHPPRKPAGACDAEPLEQDRQRPLHRR